MALIDPLTGLYNQRYLMRHLRGLLDSGQSGDLAVLMIDVDHFKSVNDDYGHAVGDKALQAIADALRANTRVFDSLARYGGEEFVVVMPGTDPDDARQRGRAAARRGRGRSQFEPRAPAARQTDGQHRRRLQPRARRLTPKHLLRAADQALYAAKRTGRNRVERRAAETRQLLDLGFLERDVLAHHRVVLLQFHLAGLRAGILLGDVEIAGVGAGHELNLDGVGLRHGLVL